MDLQTLIERVRIIISEPEDDMVSDDEIKGWLNDALDVISERKVFSCTARIQLIEGQTEYILPENFIDYCGRTSVKLEAEGKEYPIEFLTEPESDALENSSYQYTAFTRGGYYTALQRENKIVFRNYVPGEDDTSVYLLIRYFRYHEYMVADTDTPYRLLRTQHMCLIDYAAARFFEDDQETQLSIRHDDKFFKYWLPRIEDHFNAKNLTTQKKITRASNLKQGFYGVVRR